MIPHRTLGQTGPTVFPLALGCMALSNMYGATDEAEAVATVQAAIDAGVTLLDTGDFYSIGHNERLVGRAIAGRRDQVQISVKFGALRAPGGGWIGVDNRPASVKNFCAYSLDRLGVDYIDVYRPGRLDPAVPIEDTVGAIAELVAAGYVRHIGLSEVSAETVRRAAAVHPIADVQLEYSLLSRRPETTHLPALRALGVGVTAYGVLSRGLLTGAKPRAGDFRAWLPRFQPENLARNLPLAETLAAIAHERGATPAQIAFAWALSKGPDIVPLMGARSRAQLLDTLGALRIELSAEEIAAQEAAVPAEGVAGERYAPAQMAGLDSER